MLGKIAFLFLTLLGGNEKSWIDFFSGHEKLISLSVYSQLSPQNALILQAKGSRWNSLIGAARELLQQALKDEEVTKFVFLDQSVIPQVPFSSVYDVLMKEKKSVFNYIPQKQSANQKETALHWVVFDRDHAELLVQNGEHVRIATASYTQGPYPSTFSNYLRVLHDTALLVEEKVGIESIRKIVPTPAVSRVQDAGPVDFSKYGVDFEIAMGKYDLYLKPFYEKCLVEALDFWKQSVSLEPPHLFFNFLKNVYEENKPGKVRPDETHRIPPTVHQIWIGPKPFPEKYKKWQKTWQSIPGWRYKLWTDKDVEQFPFINKDLYDQEKNIGARADILRMEILYREGGLYIDTDFECLQPELFDLFNRTYDFYAGITPLDGQAYLIANGLIASIPGHPILRAYIEERRHIVAPKTCTGIVMRGPGFLTKLIHLHANKKHRDILFPPSFFYALPIYPPKEKGLLADKQGHLAHLMHTEEGREEIKNLVLKSESIAIHWWEGAWVIVDGKPVC